ncbi:MAG: 8-amino-7-oxononanoate synthase [Bacteroidota bacterium]|nr:8-amino-7-oxononanoate synthase [Bacteroidota bacterium]
MNEDFLDKKLQERIQANALRSLIINKDKIDFCSNDYLGIVKNQLIEKSISHPLSHGSGGSRLLSGNYPLIEETENSIAAFHDAEAGLIFNSGYDANTGVLASVPQKNDTIIYDQLSHASLRDGIRLSFATSFSFLHNDTRNLEKKLAVARNNAQNLFVVTESVFSMDGDYAPLKAISDLCEKYNAALIVDEAHATGVVGQKGKGLVQQLHLQKKCFARIHTFGKACGAHGAIVLGSEKLKKYLVNFARTFIYSTALPPSAVEAIALSYQTFPTMEKERTHINELIGFFKNAQLPYRILPGQTPIQVVIIPGNEVVKKIAQTLQENHFDIRPILYPTVPKGQERLRMVLHSFNKVEEVEAVVALLSKAKS